MSDNEAQQPRRGITGLSRLLLTISLVLMVGGGAFWIYETATKADTPDPGEMPAPAVETDPRMSSATEGVTSGFVDLEELPEGLSEAASKVIDQDTIDMYSPAIFRLGFSFFAGFAIAYALRSFLKMATIVSGVVLLALFGLQAAGVANIDWGAISDQFEVLMAKAKDQAESFKTFITGYLPSTGAGGFGMLMGFRRK